jgi:hypothetical protein
MFPEFYIIVYRNSHYMIFTYIMSWVSDLHRSPDIGLSSDIHYMYVFWVVTTGYLLEIHAQYTPIWTFPFSLLIISVRYFSCGFILWYWPRNAALIIIIFPFLLLVHLRQSYNYTYSYTYIYICIYMYIYFRSRFHIWEKHATLVLLNLAYFT